MSLQKKLVLLGSLLVIASIIVAIGSLKHNEPDQVPANPDQVQNPQVQADLYSRSGIIKAISGNRIEWEVAVPEVNSAGVAVPKPQKKFVNITPTSEILKQSQGKTTAATAADLKVGQSIIVYSLVDSNASEAVNAQKILIQ